MLPVRYVARIIAFAPHYWLTTVIETNNKRSWINSSVCGSSISQRQLVPFRVFTAARTETFSSADNSNNNETIEEDDQFHKKYHLIGNTTKTKKFTKNSSGTTITNGRHTIQTDLPKIMGGTDIAPQPVELLLASLIGCTQATALFVSRHLFRHHHHHRYKKTTAVTSDASDGTTATEVVLPKEQQVQMQLDRLEFDIHGIRDERGSLHLPITENHPTIPSRLLSVHGTIKVYMTNNQTLSTELLHILKEQTELRCPIANMIVASGCRIDINWVVGSNG